MKGPNRYAARRDGNEAEIVAALEAAGCDVYRLDMPCDLLVGRAGVNYLLEVKNPGTYGKLAPHQREFAVSWRGGRVAVVETIDEALQAVGLRKGGSNE